MMETDFRQFLYKKLDVGRRLLTCLVLFIGLALSTIPHLFAQLVITSPIQNQVVQRDRSSLGLIHVTAYSYFPYERVEATLSSVAVPYQQTLKLVFPANQLRNGFLSATIEAPAGWYKITLHGYGPHGIKDSSSISPVGIGEVFLVAGNSNAMGLPNLGAKSAAEHVITFNSTNKILNKENITVAPDVPMAAPQFSPIKSESALYPSGETAWYWAN